MEGCKNLLLCAAFLVCLIGPGNFAHASFPRREIGGGELRGRRLQDISECEIETNTDYPGEGKINDGKRTILFSAKDCCKKCNEREDCKVWTYIKSGEGGSQKGECWMRNIKPQAIYCSYCDSGVKKKKTVTEVLDECEEDGRRIGSEAVYRGACAILKNECPPPPETARRIALPERKAAPVSATAALADDVTEKTCEILFEEACTNEATESAYNEDGDCGEILRKGPGRGSEDCKNLRMAVEIFENAVEAQCRKDD